MPAMWQLGAYAVGLVLIAAGVWWLVHRPDPDAEPVPEPDQADGGAFARLRRARERASGPTRTVVGLCLVLLGYHTVAWAGPEWLFSFRVPPDRWWLLVTAIAVLIVGTLLADRLEAP
jgi:uncharacterized membrane protein YphA (DoxX/SURF4 family)